MQSVASWFVAAVVVLVVVACGSIYGADYFERAWGRGGSLQIVLMIGLALAFAGAVGYVIAANVRGLKPTRRNAMLAGALFEVALFAFVEGTKHLLPMLNSPFVAVLAAFVLGSASTWLLPRHVA
jgi:hypothetical protein